MSETFSILIDSRSRFETGQPGGCFFGQLQFVQLVNEVIAIVGFASDSGVYPVAVKVLCKVDKVFHAPGVFPQR